MSTFGNPGPNPPGAPPARPIALPSGPPGPPKVDMMASAEMQAWLGRLKVEDRKIGTRNKYLAVALAAGVLLLLVILWGVHRATVGAYAVIDGIQIEQHRVDQGRLLIKFNVVSRGKVYCRRKSGDVETDVIYYFGEPRQPDEPWTWSWVYQPGEPIDLTLWYRGGLLRKTYTDNFPTLKKADIVILMDITSSMEPYIAELKEKCVTFSEKLEKKDLKPRFALIKYGDAKYSPWLDRHDFTADVKQFKASVSEAKQFDGGDSDESALDALEEALALPFDKDAIHRFYLVTNAGYHKGPPRSDTTVEKVTKGLNEKKVLLRVFSEPTFKEDYQELLGQTGRFQEIEDFGKVLSEGRILED